MQYAIKHILFISSLLALTPALGMKRVPTLKELNEKRHIGIQLGEELIKAATSGDLETTTKLLESGANARYISDIQTTPLIEAAANGHLAICQKLLEAGADLHYFGLTISSEVKIPKDAIQPCYISALICAAQLGRKEICDLFLNHDASLMRIQLASALKWAAILDHKQTCEMFIEKIFKPYTDLKQSVQALLCCLRTAYTREEYNQFRNVFKAPLYAMLAQEWQLAHSKAHPAISQISAGITSNGSIKQYLMQKYCNKTLTP